MKHLRSQFMITVEIRHEMNLFLKNFETLIHFEECWKWINLNTRTLANICLCTMRWNCGEIKTLMHKNKIESSYKISYLNSWEMTEYPFFTQATSNINPIKRFFVLFAFFLHSHFMDFFQILLGNWIIKCHKESVTLTKTQCWVELISNCILFIVKLKLQLNFNEQFHFVCSSVPLIWMKFYNSIFKKNDFIFLSTKLFVFGERKRAEENKKTIFFHSVLFVKGLQ